MSRPCVFVTRTLPERGLTALIQAGYELHVNPLPTPLRPEQLVQALRTHDGVIGQVSDRFDRDTLRAGAGRCRVLATCAVGYDNIDVPAAAEFGIVVTNTPGVLTEATADLTWALLLATARRVCEAERFLRAGAWRGWGMMDFLGVDVHGQCLGIVGAGAIGTAVARRASGFGMRILYCSRSKKAAMEELGARLCTLHELLAESDFISLHVSLNPQTHRLIDAAAFKHIRPGAILINTARGNIVDQAELIDALQTGRLAGAGLDVFEKEPAVPAELLAMDNVVLLPHIGSATSRTRSRMAEIAAENVIAVLNGGKALTPVLP